ncbi:MAG: hypothetical protein ABIJ95_13090 [Pseudomonadota bacterium]
MTETDQKRADQGGLMPIGKYLCICRTSVPREKHFNAYSCVAANLKWEVVKVLELSGKAPTEAEAEALRGRNIFDDVNMPNPKEKDGMRNRRILVAKRTGLLDGTDGVLKLVHWKTAIVGKRAVLSIIHEEDKKTGKTYAKVPFDGYDAEGTDAAGSTAPDAKADSFDDI